MEIKIPVIGESIKEARILRWLKQDGDYVKRDEPVLEIETDKASDFVPAPADGLVRILVKADETVAVGAVIGKIEPGSPPATANGSSEVKTPAKAKEPILSPAAQRVAAEKNIDPATITGTGREGRIIKEDVLAVKTKPVASPAPPESKPIPVDPGQRETRQRMTQIRQRIGERLVASQQTTATLTTFNEVDLSAINELRARYKDKFKEKYGTGLGYMSFFVKAAVEGLKAFPTVNARIDGVEIVFQHFYDIGVAVSTERGLLVPVLRGADQLGFADIEKQIGDLAALARESKITTSHLQGGTFTITNGGIFGSLLSTPILNPPQCAILGMHTIQKRPVVVNDEIVIRPMMYIALSYDHRLIDGREAVQFLVRIKDCIENPERMLLAI
ncbi:MAG: 2-oxoglutarate dehydrogenase complex dihydrolipoyllysine-residue succinyltransferase [Planctomycetes bacterium]|nr:2-oxoglutarate dehydrogenase complex dihydrolipoyllysine-residue succinyltransferase [Planctomycetota bacterium]